MTAASHSAMKADRPNHCHSSSPSTPFLLVLQLLPIYLFKVYHLGLGATGMTPTIDSKI